MNYFIQGNSNMYRVNLLDFPEEASNLSVNQLYIKLANENIVISYETDMYSNIITIPENKNWLQYKSEPFLFERDSVESSTFTISIIKGTVLTNDIKYHYKNKKYIIDKSNTKYKAIHKKQDIGLVKVYLEFDEFIYNTIEYLNRAQERRLSFLLGTHLMLNESYEIMPDTVDAVIKPTPFYLVVRDENDNLLPVEYFLFSFKIY